ncbi:hypothetical protein [Agrobacterium tumefaciens]|nr:hypothetical protein [Agrobacterium tumefaciens]MBP2535227.1 hypothetical protein [Agrobacterium tumefaciens]
MVRAHGKAAQPGTAAKSGDRIDRAAMWSKAMKAAASGPRVRVEGE